MRGGMLALALLWSIGAAWAQDKPSSRSRRPVHEDTERTPYRLRERAPTAAEELRRLKAWLARELFPTVTRERAEAEIDKLAEATLAIERDPRRGAERLAAAIVPLLRARIERRGDEDGATVLARLFHRAGLGAEAGYQLGSSRGDADARRVENLYELVRMAAWLALVEEGAQARVEDEPFTRVERARPSEPELAFQAAFVAAYRRR